MKADQFVQLFALPALFAAGLAAGACASHDDVPGRPLADSATNAIEPETDHRGAYVLDHPDVSYALPDDLTEISGLATLDDGRLGAIQDEDGIVFILDAATGAIVDRIAFGDDGDYEGVELAGDRLFVLRSNGNVLELTGWQQGRPKVRTYKTDLERKQDTEGLAYDPVRRRLLVVTKEDPGEGLDEDRHRAIYAFDPATGTLEAEPVAVIDLDAIRTALPDLDAFKPSALAIHPASGDLYVLSSTDPALATLGPDGTLRSARRLSDATFEQPEGLAFLPNGDLFVASEGVDRPATLARFAARR